MTDSKTLLKITTVQTGAFKSLIEALNNILVDCNIECFPDEGEGKEGYMKILAVNNQSGMLVHMKLHSFDEFICTTKQTIGISIQLFYKIIKTINNNDILTIQRTSDDINKLHIKIMNKDKKQVFSYSLQIVDVDSEVLDVSQASFQAVTIMSSVDFQKVCKDMMGIEAKYVDITLVDNKLTVLGKGEFVQGSAEFPENGSTVVINRKDEHKDLIITGRYELKNLILFTKCTGLCNHIEIFMKNDFPLLIKYSISSLGYLHLCLSPIIEESY
jgi:proliferating cell nuclear antigen